MSKYVRVIRDRARFRTRSQARDSSYRTCQPNPRFDLFGIAKPQSIFDIPAQWTVESIMSADCLERTDLDVACKQVIHAEYLSSLWDALAAEIAIAL